MYHYPMIEICSDPCLLDFKLRDIYEKILMKIIKHHNLDFRLFETLRSPERQRKLFDDGFTKTLTSKHLGNNLGKSEAMDLVFYVDGKPTWDARYRFYYTFLGNRILEDFGNDLIWGGKFKSFFDGPHFQLR